jgi:hypothetical protein
MFDSRLWIKTTPAYGNHSIIVPAVITVDQWDRKGFDFTYCPANATFIFAPMLAYMIRSSSEKPATAVSRNKLKGTR